MTLNIGTEITPADPAGPTERVKASCPRFSLAQSRLGPAWANLLCGLSQKSHPQPNGDKPDPQATGAGQLARALRGPEQRGARASPGTDLPGAQTAAAQSRPPPALCPQRYGAQFEKDFRCLRMETGHLGFRDLFKQIWGSAIINTTSMH